MGRLTMIAHLLVVSLTVGASAPADTTVTLNRGDDIVIENFSGSLSVGTWDRDRLEIRGSDSDRVANVVVRREGSQVVVRSADSRGRQRAGAIVIRVPKWVSMEIRGRDLSVSAVGLAGSLMVRNVEGDVRVEGTSGTVAIRSIQGSVTVIDASGPVSASSRGEDVILERVTGPIVAESGEGDITLRDVESPSVRAETQDGDILFDGVLAADGQYGFFVHDGDATVAVQNGVSATVRVSTFEGDFQSDFPVMVQRFRGGREFDFKLGDGSARLQIEVFDGEIRLVRRR